MKLKDIAPKSAYGILCWRIYNGKLEVFIVHPGGPHYDNIDNGVWDIPKGVKEDGEDDLITAKREFEEETGFTLPQESKLNFLGTTKTGMGKKVYIWHTECQNAQFIKSNTFIYKDKEYPEIDKGQWFNINDAYKKLRSHFSILLDKLKQINNITE